MNNNYRSNLFYLKQYGFSYKLLNELAILKCDPLKIIFSNKSMDYISFFSERDLELSKNYYHFKNFKKSLYIKNEFLRDKKNSKIYFKYDINEVTQLLPSDIMPLFMYSIGNRTLLSVGEKRVAIIGTRNPTAYSIKLAEIITKNFITDDFVIVSGLAEGIDSIAHETALNQNAKTIAILPTNFKNIYPKQNEKLARRIQNEGLLLTAIGPSETTYKSNFLDRNKYLANIVDSVVVVETSLQSGTMNTIRNASYAKKKIFFIDQNDSAINNKIYSYGGEIIHVQKR